MATSRRLFVGSMALGLVAALPALAQPAEKPPGDKPNPAETIKHLPADVVTHHVLDLPGRALHLTATAGSITLSNAAGVAQAQIGFIAYTLDDQPVEKRPVSFAMNGGPGSASAWLQLGMLGPWRLRMDPEAAVPSAAPVPTLASNQRVRAAAAAAPTRAVWIAGAGRTRIAAPRENRPPASFVPRRA